VTFALRIRLAAPDDWPLIRPIVMAVIDAGDTYVWEGLGVEDARTAWMEGGGEVYVAIEGDAVLGTYVLKQNQPGRGSHVCNAAFMVADDARGKGVGRTMAVHAIERAREVGYQGMQFNLVVETNRSAVALWPQLGFEVVGRVPRAFRHAEHGLVDALIMYRSLEP